VEIRRVSCPVVRFDEGGRSWSVWIFVAPTIFAAWIGKPDVAGDGACDDGVSTGQPAVVDQRSVCGVALHSGSRGFLVGYGGHMEYDKVRSKHYKLHAKLWIPHENAARAQYPSAWSAYRETLPQVNQSSHCII
jgi:hypothetical protein